MGLDAAIIGMLNKLVNQPATGQQREAWHIHHRGQPQWTDAGAKANMPGVKGAAATGAKASDGKIHVYLGTNWASGHPYATNTHYAYDPVTNTWTTLANTPQKLENPAGETLQGKPYYATGNTGYAAYGFTTYAAYYDPTTNTWTSIANYPASRSRASATATDTEFHVSGGQPPHDTSNTWYAYNSSTNTWTSKGTLPVKIAGHAFAWDPSTSYFYLALGELGYWSNKTTQSWYYNGTAWVAIADAPGTGTDVSAYAGDGTFITVPASGTTAYVYTHATNTWATYAVDQRSSTQTGYYRDEQGKWHLYRFGGKDSSGNPTTATREYIYTAGTASTSSYTKEFAGVCILSVSYVNTATDIQVTITDEFGKTYDATVNATIQTPYQLGIYSQPTVQVDFTDEGEIIIIQT